eukprot:36586_1
MGNSGSHYGGHYRPRFGGAEWRMLYGRGGIRTRQRTLSAKSSSQVEDAKEKFIHLVFETDFDFMPESAKIQKQIWGHMTKDARNAVRDYAKSLHATAVFRAQKQRYRGQNRVFHGKATITPATKRYILENKPDIFREIFVICELSLCTFLCYAGIPHNDASGWILNDIQQNEFEQINDIKQYLTDKSLTWIKPKHVTKYTEFKGKKPKGLEEKLKNRNLGITIEKKTIRKGNKNKNKNNSSNREIPAM